MNKYNFDEVYDRRGSDCKKYNPGKFSKEVLPMWIADTDFRVPEAVIKVARERVDHEAFGYPYELPEFNTAVQGYMKRRHNWEIKAEDVEFVTGVVPGAIFFIEAFSHPGDFVIVQTPLYSPLQEAVVDNGRHLHCNHIICDNGKFSIDFEDFEKKAADPRTKIFILVNPHNPLGKYYTTEELQRMGDICAKHDVLIFSDEIHSDFVYDGKVHTPIASLSETIAEITMTSSNPGKSFNVAGVRTAFVYTQNKKMMEQFVIARKKAKAMGRTVVGQQVFIACYSECDEYIDELVPYVEANVDYAVDFIKKNIPLVKFTKPDALYLLWLDCTAAGLTQPELMSLLEKEGQIGMNSGTDFGPAGEGFARLNVAVPRKTLEEGLNRLKKAFDSLGK